MDLDPERRRAALKDFIHQTKLVVSAWEKDARTGDGTVRKFLSGSSNTLTEKTYLRLASSAARLLGRDVLVTDLKGVEPSARHDAAISSDVRRLDPPLVVPHGSAMERTVPVYGTVAGVAGGLQMGREYALDWVRRPPRFLDRKDTPKDIFAVLVEEVSMAPRFGPGDLLYIDPLRHPKVGDSVLAEIRQDGGIRTILRALTAQTDCGGVTLAQYNPPGSVDVPHDQLVHLYRVMTTNDLLGA